MERRYFYLGDLLFDVLFGEREFDDAVDRITDYCDAPLQTLELSEQYRSSLETVFAVDISELLFVFDTSNTADYPLMDNSLGNASMSRRSETSTRRKKSSTSRHRGSARNASSDLEVDESLERPRIPDLDESALSTQRDKPSDELRLRRHEAAATIITAVHALSSRMRIRDAKTALSLLGSLAATAIVDEAGQVIDCNPSFERFCKRHGVDMETEASTLWKLGIERSAFQQALHAKRRTVLVRDGSSGPPAYFCTIARMPAIAFSIGNAGTAMATFREIGDVDSFDRASMIEDLSLTEAEVETAILLASGMTTNEISESRSVTVHTTRSLIKRALSKTGTRSQAELVSVIFQYRM